MTEMEPRDPEVLDDDSQLDRLRVSLEEAHTAARVAMETIAQIHSDFFRFPLASSTRMDKDVGSGNNEGH